jgi:hypothetical protein
MAFRLPKGQLRQKQTHLTTLREDQQAFEGAVMAYNGAVARAREWVQKTANGMRSEYDDSKTERWQDSQTGQAVSVWLDEWDNLDADLVEVLTQRLGRLRPLRISQGVNDAASPVRSTERIVADIR